ncbi:MAG: tetratricopeptide repeat protein [Planctomycetota bacterium]
MLALGIVVAFVGACSPFLLPGDSVESGQPYVGQSISNPRLIRLRGFEGRLTRHPEDVEAWKQYAEFLTEIPAVEQASLKEVINAWQKCTQLEPGNPKHWYRHSTACRAAGQIEQALQSAKQTLRISPGNQQFVALLASLQMEVGDTQEANRLIDDAIPSSSSRWQLVLLRVRGMVQDAKSNKSIVAAVKRAQLEYPKDHGIDGVLAYAMWVTGDEQIARNQIMSIADDLSIGGVEYARFLAVLSRSMGMDDVTQSVCRSTKETRRDPFLSLLAARHSWELGNPSDVIINLQSRPLSLSTDPEACLLMALALRALGKTSQLRSSLRDFARQRGCRTTDAWYRLIHLLVKKQQASVREVANAANDVRKLSTNSPLVCYIHGSAFFLLGEYEVAHRIALRAASQSPRWELPQYLLVNTSIMMGDPHQALAIARKTAGTFPDQFDAKTGYAITQAIMLPQVERKHAERLLRWTSNVKISFDDPRVEEIALIRCLANLRLGSEAEASAIRDEFLSRWKSLPTDALVRVMTLRRQRIIASGAMNIDADISSSIESGGGNSENVLVSESSVSESSVSESSVSESSVSESSVSESSVDEVKESTDGEVGWRIDRARELLTSNCDESNAASAALVLRPVVKAMPRHVDARLLMGVAMLRLHDHSAANDHFLAVVTHDPTGLHQVLRLSLGCRRAGHWTDAQQLADFWVLAGRTAATQAYIQHQRVVGNANSSLEDSAGAIRHLQALAAFAEQTKDRPLAIAAYRRLLRIDATNAVACNNLAYLIHKQADSLDEAVELSTIAIRQQPGHVEFQRTMQSIQEHRQALENSTSRSVSRLIKSNEREIEQ